jgi:arginase
MAFLNADPLCCRFEDAMPDNSPLHRPLAGESPIAVIGVPCGLGAGMAGTHIGPAAARAAGLVSSLSELGHPVVDQGDLASRSPAPGVTRHVSHLGHHAERISLWLESLHDATLASLEAGQRPLVIGGDHSMAMGSISAVARHVAAAGKKLVVLWIDAHADFNTPQTSPSGNLHGMSLAFLTGNPELAALLPDRSFPAVPPADVCVIGARSIDLVEKRAIAEAGIACIDMRAIDEFGVCSLLRDALAGCDPATTHVHLSFDVDVVDPELAPAVGTPVPGGLTYREAHLVMEMLHETGLVGSVDVVELNPMLDVRGQTARLVVDLMGSLFGKTITFAANARPMARA